MGVLDDVFAGASGVTNVLLDTLGAEVMLEFELERLYQEETDASQVDVKRQIVAGVVTEKGFLVSAANLERWVLTEKTRVHLNKRVYQVMKAVPQYVGNVVHTWEIEAVEI